MSFLNPLADDKGARHSQQAARTAPNADLLAVDEAQARILAAVSESPAETISLTQAHGRICAADVVSRLSHPPIPVSAMDGYACRSADVTSLPVRLTQIGVSRAGDRFAGTVTEGTCVRIFTGGMVPDGTDIIALQEDARAHGRTVEIREVAKIGQHIRRAGMDFAAGDVCVNKGRVLTARDIGLLASCGHAVVAVRRKPKVAILSTGDELVPPGVAPGIDQIVGSNGIALAAAAAGWGAVPVDLGIASDDIETITAMVQKARDADVLVTTGGASVGDHDLVQIALERLGFVPDFWRIAMRPGKPLMYGRLGTLPVLGMPGNPVSALVCALLFLRPLLRAMGGVAPAVPAFDKAALGADMKPNDKREDYVRAQLGPPEGSRTVVFPFPTQDSSMLMTLARAEVLIRRPSYAPAARKGDEVEIIRLDSMAGFF